MDSLEYNLCLNVEKKFQGNCHQHLEYEGWSLSKHHKSALHELPKSRLLRIAETLKSTKTPSKPQPIRRQFTRPRRRNKKKTAKPPPAARNALQMSLLLLSILAFGTFAATAVMRHMRKHNRREHSTYKIIINKTPRMEEPPVPATDNTSFVHWASIFVEGITEFVGEISDQT